MGLTDRKTKPVLIRGNSNQVNVIGHQAVSPNVHCVRFAPIGHQFNIGLIIAIIEECLLPTVTPLGDVMGIARYYYSCDPRHDSRYQK